jgi:hypothetical protein
MLVFYMSQYETVDVIPTLMALLLIEMKVGEIVMLMMMMMRMVLYEISRSFSIDYLYLHII